MNKDNKIDSKKVFQQVFQGFTEGDLVHLTDSLSNRRVKVIKIFPDDDGPYSNLVLIERDGKRELIGIKLLRP